MIRLALIGEEYAEQYAAAAERLGNVELRPFAKNDLSSGRRTDVDAVVVEGIAEGLFGDEVLVDNCRDAGIPLVLGNASRFLPSLQTAKTSLDSGKLGDPGLLRIRRWESRERKADGVPLVLLTHEVDLALWLFGTLPTSVYALGRRDYAQVHIGFPKNASALIDYSSALPPGENYFSLSLIGSTGAAYADDHHNMQLLYRDGQPSALRTGQGDGILAQLREITTAIEEGRDPPIAIAEARSAIQVVEAAYQSVSSGRAAHLVRDAYELV